MNARSCAVAVHWCVFFMVWFVCEITQAQQNPHGQLPVGSSSEPYLFLLRDPVVHAQLTLTTKQKSRLQAINDQLDGLLWPMRNQRLQQVNTTARRLKIKTKQQLQKVLDRDQLRRLDEIEMRMLGVRAFLRPEIVQMLGVNREQQDSIREIFSETRESVKQLQLESRQDSQDQNINDAVRQLQITEQKNVLAVLNGQQRQKWQTSLGPPVDLRKIGRVKFRAPEFLGQRGWLNSPPLTRQKLSGKVVALFFYAYG
ncbi:MAG: hypothetical protein MK102_00840 [Fuerstiella sp.]|nr:hypothetical protein [Fuerstiella sp.]